MNNFSKQELTKETEFRAPVLQKFETAKSCSVSQDSSTMLSLDSIAPLVNNQGALSQKESSVFEDKSPMVSLNIRSVKSDPAAETSAMDCDETFHSTCEEVDTTYYSFEGSSTDSLNNDSHSENENQSRLIGLSEVSLTKASGTHNNVSQKSKTEDSSIGEISRCNDLEEKQDFGVVLSAGKCTEDCDITPSAGSSTEEAESPGCLESNIENFIADYKSSSDDLLKAGHGGVCDDFQQGEYGKDSDQVDKPLDGPQFSETANDYDFSDEFGSFGAKDGEQDSSCDDLKEEGNDEESDQIGKPFNDVHFQEDLNDGASLDGSDSSDEDLLTPPRFLYEKAKLKPDIRTPEKGIAPAYATPSPVTGNAAAKEEKSIKYKLSFDKLIAEKAKHRERDAELAEMEAELQRGIANGGIVQMQVPSTFSDIESEEELTDGKLGKSVLPRDSLGILYLGCAILLKSSVKLFLINKDINCECSHNTTTVLN